MQDEQVAQLKPATDQGNATVQYQLGCMHLDGRGVAQDDKQAAALFKLAADQGYAMAQYQLGGMHLFGRGVAQDDKRAAALLKLAADQGFAMAQCRLGIMHLDGRGVAKDDKRAAVLLKLAADQGNALAQRLLMDLLYVRTPVRPPVEELKLGSLVLVEGLAKRPELNGEIGEIRTVRSVDDAIGRYGAAASSAAEPSADGMPVVAGHDRGGLSIDDEQARADAMMASLLAEEERRAEAEAAKASKNASMQSRPRMQRRPRRRRRARKLGLGPQRQAKACYHCSQSRRKQSW